MKWLVTALLLVNAAYFAWQYRHMPEAPAAVPGETQDGGGESRMRLLGEVKDEKLRLRAADPVPPDPAEAEARSPTRSLLARTPLERNCYSIGPLKKDSRIAAMRTWLIAMGGDPMLRVDERRELERYWVYFPPQSSREEALEKVRRMRSEGIKDLLVVPRGDMANAISLGVFSRQSSLDRRLEELRRQGYEPSIKPSYRAEKASWFDVAFEEGQTLSRDELGARFPGVELSAASCAPPEIARGREDS